MGILHGSRNYSVCHVGRYTQTEEKKMNPRYNSHDYKIEQAIKESLAKDVDRFAKMFKNKKDMELAKKIIKGQA